MARRDGLLKLAAEHRVLSVLLVSQKPSSEAEDLRDQISQFFRCRFLSGGILDGLYPTPAAAAESLKKVLAEEEVWADLIRPTDTADPLLLPENFFLPHPEFQDVWRAAIMASSAIQISDVSKFVQRFGEAHRASRVGSAPGKIYNAVNRLHWDYTGPVHATAPFPREWKFSYNIPSGFHYDVTHGLGQAFTFRDAEGISAKVAANNHINVDPHGFAR